MMRGQAGMFIMVLIGIVIIATLYLVQNKWVQDAFEIKAEAEIYIDLNDNTAKLVSLLKSKTWDRSFMEALACQIDDVGGCDDQADIESLADSMDVSIILYDEDGKVKGTHGTRKLGNVLIMDIPLPGGRSSQLGMRTDFDYEEGVTQQREEIDNLEGTGNPMEGIGLTG